MIGVVNCQKSCVESNIFLNVTEVPANAYADYVKFHELSKKLEESEATNNAYKAMGRASQTMQRLFQEQLVCEKAGNCETSKEFTSIFNEYIADSLSAQKAIDEMRESLESKELREFFSKYQQ